jgi:formate-nitrite transporter family protein
LGRHQNLERTHLLQASVEVFLLVVNGDLAVWSMVTDFTVPVLLGNIVGGTALF